MREALATYKVRGSMAESLLASFVMQPVRAQTAGKRSAMASKLCFADFCV